MCDPVTYQPSAPSPCHQSRPELLVAQCCGRWNRCKPCRSSAYHLRDSNFAPSFWRKFGLNRLHGPFWVIPPSFLRSHFGLFPSVFWGPKGRRITRMEIRTVPQPQTVEGFKTVHKAIRGGRLQAAPSPCLQHLQPPKPRHNRCWPVVHDTQYPQPPPFVHWPLESTRFPAGPGGSARSSQASPWRTNLTVTPCSLWNFYVYRR